MDIKKKLLNSMLIKAVLKQDYDLVDKLLLQGASINYFECGSNALCFAIRLGDIHLIKKILVNNSLDFFNFNNTDLLAEILFFNKDRCLDFKNSSNMNDLIYMFNLLCNHDCNLSTNISLFDCKLSDDFFIDDLLVYLINLKEKNFFLFNPSFNNVYSNYDYELIFKFLCDNSFDFVSYEKNLKFDRTILLQVVYSKSYILKFFINLYIENEMFDKLYYVHDVALLNNFNSLVYLVNDSLSNVDFKKNKL